MQLKLADAGTVLRPVTTVMHTRSQFVDQQTLRGDKALHRHHAHIAQLLHNRRQHLFGLRLLLRIGLRESDAGTQNTVLMQVMRQRIKHGATIKAARANQRHFAREVYALLDNTFAVAFSR